MTCPRNPLRTIFALSVFGVFAPVALGGADIDLSVYSASPNGVSSIDRTTIFDAPLQSQFSTPHIGFRLTNWIDSKWGIGIDYNTTLLRYTLPGSAQNTADFAHISNVSVRGTRRFDYSDSLSPYLGVGVGFSHMNTQESASFLSIDGKDAANSSFSSGIVGAQYKIEDNISVFSEFKLDYAPSSSSAYDFNSGFQFDASNVNQSINFGVVLSF